jgi:hypothetical protein
MTLFPRTFALPAFALFVACGGSVLSSPGAAGGTLGADADGGSVLLPDAARAHHPNGPSDAGAAGSDEGDGPVCGGPDGGPSFYITPSPIDLSPACGPVQLVAVGTYSDCTHHAVSDVTWSSSDAAVATINATGLLTAIQGPNGMPTIGTATITATAQGLSASATIHVIQPLRLMVSPPSVTVPVGGIKGFRATANFSDGTTCDATQAAFWTSSVSSVATIETGPINTGGVATTVASGTSVITAVLGDQQGTATLTVISD